jgi:hypothetical protein
MLATRVSPSHLAEEGLASLWLCIAGLLGVFAVRYPGYFVFDVIWPSFYYSPVAVGKNAWLMAQAFFIAVTSPTPLSHLTRYGACSAR